jgi:threonine dehydrogenase-like Zn-dependent dehydrogenase
LPPEEQNRKAIAVVTGTPNIRLVERPEPQITADDEVKLRIVRVGICGTDREEAAGGRALAASTNGELVIGHEMMGEVVDTGARVSRVKKGDFAVMTVRRGCSKCMPCAMNRSDMCRTGEYHERGIWGIDGYQTEFVVDREQYVVAIPPNLAAVGVLTEPLTIVEKAIDLTVRLQLSRLPDAPATPEWLHGRCCLVAGLGPVGLLAAMALRLRGARVFGFDIVDAGTVRPKWLETIGGQYLDGRQVPPEKIASLHGEVELIVEAAGFAPVMYKLIHALGPNAAYVMTGIPGGDAPLDIDGAALLRTLVLGNQLIVGSVNAARDHYQMAVDDLAYAVMLWGDHVSKLITHRAKFDAAGELLHQHPADEIKAVVEWM